VLQIAEGLDQVHAQDVVHCDVKPQNVILSEDPGSRRKMQAKILDFGLARTGASKPAKEINGTPEYLPPEVALGEPLTGAADVYSLGIVFYELLSGRLPFTGTVQEILVGHVGGAVPALSDLCEAAPDPAIASLISRALEKKVEDRHQSMAAFIYELKNAMDMQGFGKRKHRRARPGSANLSPSVRAEPPKPEPAEPFLSITFDAPRETERSERDDLLAESLDAMAQPLAFLGHDGEVKLANVAFAVLLSADVSELEGTNLSATQLSRAWPELADDLEVAAGGLVAARELSIMAIDGNTERYQARLEATSRANSLSLSLVAL